MGNCFGKTSSSSGDSFSKPGRPLSSAIPAQQPTSRVPTAPNSPGRTLGNGADTTSGDPKAAAARAAEERAKASQGKGKLGRQLDAQKARTNSEVLIQASRENRASRGADAVAETRAYN